MTPWILLHLLLAFVSPAFVEKLAHGSLTETSPRLSWTLHANSAQERGIIEQAYEIRVHHGAKELWNSGRIVSSAMDAMYAGKPLPDGEPVSWQVRTWQRSLTQKEPVVSDWSKAASFTMPLRTWSAKWIAGATDPNAALPLFRRAVTMTEQPVQAMLFISGLGQYEIRLNGRSVSPDLLTPGWTDYRKTILYDTYDVQAMLHRGENVIGILLGNGMYNVPETPGRYSKFTGSMGQPKLLVELHLAYADGTRKVIASDGSWRTAAGPITFSNTYGGEDFDGRREPPNWDEAGFDDTAWKPAMVVESPGGELVPEQTPPVRVLAHYPAVTTTSPRPTSGNGVVVYDLGQNFAGWPVLTATGPAGSVVRLLPGELLNPDGSVTQHSFNASPGDPLLFQYTLRGDAAPEQWHPRFSYTGFRYVQVEASNPQVKILSVDGEAIHADTPEAGNFSTSNPLFQRIHTLILNALRSNLMSVLTDCPHREKLGWLEQTHLFAASLMANYDVSALYRKLSGDMADAQLGNGLVPSIAPEYVQFVDKAGDSTDFRDSPEWGSAVVLSPWAAYQAYGDPGPLHTYYESMQRYVMYLLSKANAHLLDYGLGDWYDIGPGAPGYAKLTSKRLTATATLYEDLMAMAGVAHALHKPDDELQYRLKASAVRDAFNAALFHPGSNQYDRGSQTANAMPLALGMVAEEHRAAVLANLVGDIQAHNFHVTAGDVGFHYVVRALTDGGRSDVLEKMLSQTSSPSYGYQLEQGATTLTEAWDANPNSSQNHFMLGHGEEWFYRGLAGIDLDLSRRESPPIVIRPYVGDTSEAGAAMETPLGTIRSAWRKTAPGTLTLEITVPANATATLWLPGGYNGWQEAGVALADVAGVSAAGETGPVLLLSGTYRLAGSLKVRATAAPF